MKREEGQEEGWVGQKRNLWGKNLLEVTGG